MQSIINQTQLRINAIRLNFKALDAISILLIGAIFSLFISTKLLLPDLKIANLNSTALHNLIIGVILFLYGLKQGVRWFNNPLIFIYTFILLNTFALASRHPDLSVNQILQSYMSFLLGILLLHVNLTEAVRRGLWTLIPWMAISSILVGLILDVAGLHELFRYLNAAQVYRLQGATSPKGLAHMAIVGMLICFPQAREKRFYLGLGLLNYSIIVFTASRTNMVMGLLILGVYFLPDALSFWRTRRWQSLKHSAIILIVVAVITLANSGALIGRLTHTESTKRTETDTYSSGRAYIWGKYWDAAEENLAFGHGMGAGTVAVPQTNNQLNVPHNEYLRIIVDGGIISLGLLILTYGYVFWKILRRQTTYMERLYFGAGIIIFSASALLDNVLTTQTFSVLFWTWGAILAYHNFEHEEKSPDFNWRFLKIYTGFPPQTTP